MAEVSKGHREQAYPPGPRHARLKDSNPAVEPQGSVDGCRSDVPPVVENTGGLRASSGEAAGDGVTHLQARFTVKEFRASSWWIGSGRGTHDRKGRGDELLAYIDQQEQVERKAADQLREIQQLYEAFSGSGHSPKNPREAAQAIGQMAEAESDRDAERAQKEALRVESKETKVRLDAANAICRVRLAALNHANDGRALLRCHDCDELTFVNHDCLVAQQPAEAAPVAKKEHVHDDLLMGDMLTCGECYPGVPEVAQRSEEAWVPKVGDRVKVKPGGSGSDAWKVGAHTVVRANEQGGVWLAFEEEVGHTEAGDWHFSELELVEPAPQPPATAEPKPPSPDAPVTRRELVEALRKLPGNDAQGFVYGAKKLATLLADELEGEVGK